MTDGFWLGVSSAAWLGVLTSISPCPLATNIAAISYVGKTVRSPGRAVAAALLYTLGRTIAYTALGVLLVSSLLAAPELSRTLQRVMNMAMGPLLILVGMVLLDLLSLPSIGGGMGERVRRHMDAGGLWGALPLGIVFALSFCPVSAALFFGSLLPLALARHSGLLLPAVYGVATALPVLVVGTLVALGSGLLARAYNSIAVFERWARRVTGMVFILIGIYLSLVYLFRVPF